jgi:hypothetical protein
MKFTEKLLRYPLPDQLKAVLEKFDGEFDASHLNKLDALSDSRGFTWYERRMLNRAYHKAKRTVALNDAMEMVLNLNPRRKILITPKVSSTIKGGLYAGEMLVQQDAYRNTL